MNTKNKKKQGSGEAPLKGLAGAVAPTVAVPRMQTQQKPMTVEQAMIEAARHEGAGRFQQAEMLLKRVLQAKPGYAPGWQALAILAHKVGKTEIALNLMTRAISLSDNVALFHSNKGEMCRILGRLDEAIALGKKAVALDPKSASAHGNLGIAYYDKKDYKAAEACHKAALAINPAFAPSLNNMGSILRQAKDYDGAVSWYRRAVEANPRYLEPLNNMGETFIRTDKGEEAVKVLGQALAKNPRYTEARCNQGYAFACIEKEKEALACFTTALKARPDYAEAYVGIARVRKDLYDLNAAETAIKKAVSLKPELAEAHSVLGSVYMAQGRTELARKSFEHALSLDSDMTSAKLGMGNIHLEEGRFEEAETIFKGVVDNKTERMGALFSLAQTRKVKPGDEIVALLEAEAEKLPDLSENKAIYIHFALGKVYDDLGEADKSFPHFLKGCAMKRKKLYYDADEKDKHFAHVTDVFSKEFIDRRRGHGEKSDLPIFVLGMPRSGTTLTEQIIASHPSVFGAGELFDLLDLSSGKSNFPDNMKDLTPERMAEMGAQYVAGLRARDQNARKITDKMPANFMNVGLIHLILPNAKIVHVKRNPLDTCISCFTRLFAHNQNQTYDLYELGRFYRAYSLMMDHWKKVLPKGSFYEIEYEKLIEDTDAEARKLVEYCGLEWDDKCLEFHKHERSIRTASVTQVRQPIYKSSVARWKKYEKYVEPLIKGLGEAYTGD